jgi:Sigma-70 region 2
MVADITADAFSSGTMTKTARSRSARSATEALIVRRTIGRFDKSRPAYSKAGPGAVSRVWVTSSIVFQGSLDIVSGALKLVQGLKLRITIKWTDTLSDEDLIKQIAKGDRLALGALYGRHRVKLYRFLLRLTNNEATAEDILSDVFFDVWRQAGRFERARAYRPGFTPLRGSRLCRQGGNVSMLNSARAKTQSKTPAMVLKISCRKRTRVNELNNA